ncbi:MAG: TIGR02171 family protein [Paludibacteraceae bacterium]|nr:TIGR02171 family protein [Paludibacteraceae bacterium]
MKRKIIFLFVFLFAFSLWTGCSDSEPNKTSDEIIEELDLSSSSVDNSSIESSSAETDDFIEGFVIQKGSKLVSLTDASDETGVTMKVKLDYDFYIGRTEVTRGQYAALMGGDVSDEEKNLPQVEVNFYDAVLYANALSKQDGLDSVYTYTKSVFAPSGSCVFLEGLVTHYEKRGYRLPTEAEWVYVAKRFWDIDNSWNAENSYSKLHEVCSFPGPGDTNVNIEENLDVVCNITGNVAEWVDGWLADFRDTTLTNYVGASAPNSLKENMIKGGNYRLSPNDINVNTRRDVYPIAMNSSAEYVGFRLALGVIDNPLWLDPTGRVNSVKVNIVATTESVLGALNAKRTKVKLVFRNDANGNLSFIDYNTNSSRVIEIEQDVDAFHPDVSPDGNYVAFSTQVEGLSGKSKVYVCRLDSMCSGKTELPVESAAIPRFRVLESGDTVLVYVSDAGDNRDSLTWSGYSTWYVPFAGGKFGIPQQLLKGSFNGGTTDGFAVTGSTLLRVATWDDLDKIEYDVWYNGEQACNVSLASDGSYRTLFLDFAGSTGRKFVGEKYGIHQRILVSNREGQLIGSVASPKGYAYDHTEWVSGMNFAVATLTDINGSHKKIVLVDIESGSLVELVQSDELWHPVLWVEHSMPIVAKSSSSSEFAEEKSSDSRDDESSSSAENVDVLSSSGIAVYSSSSELSAASSSSEELEMSSSSVDSEEVNSSSSEYSLVLDLDSAGIYAYSYTGLKDFIVRYKMELLWQFADSANVVVIGSSRPLDAVFPTELSSNFIGVNLGIASCTIHMSKDLFVKYVLPHYKKMKYLVVSLDLDFWWKKSTASDDNWFADNDPSAEYLRYPGFVYDKNHNYWEGEEDLTPLYEAAKNGVLYSSPRFDNMIESRGQMQTSCSNAWPGASLGSSEKNPDSKVLDASMNALKTIVEESAKRGVTVIGTILPMSPAYKDSEMFGYLGMSRSIADSLIGEFVKMESTYSNFVLFDENKGGLHDYADGMNEDAQHLCDVGAKLYTSRLDSLLLMLEGRQ